MKSLINMSMPMMALLVFSHCDAQIPNARTEAVHIYGNCGMCKKTIEKAAYKKGEAKADWDKDTKMAQITFDSNLTSADAVLQRIAEAGYDSDKFTAPDDAYNNLPDCCHYDRPAKKTEANSTSGTEAPANVSTVVTEPAPIATPSATDGMVKKQATAASGNPLSEVYAAYFALKNALVASDGTSAAGHATMLADAISRVKTETMQAAPQSVWIKYGQKLSSDAEKIRSDSNIKQQRAHFATLSKNLFEVMKVVKPETAVYYDHCPMYNEGKGGDWLSTEKVIKNPYYGKQMLNCGSITETLN